MTESMVNRFFIFFFLFAFAITQQGCESEKSNKPPGYVKETTQAAAKTDEPNPNESAYETVLRALRENPDNVREIYHLADLYYRDGKYELAIENFRKVLSYKPQRGNRPNRGYVYQQLGTALNRIQRYEEALEAYQQAVTLLSNPATVYNNMGITYGKLGRYQDEIDALQKAIELRSRYATAYYNLGITMLKVGDIEGARQQYEALNEFDLSTAKTLLTKIDSASGNQNNTTDKQ